ncbi:unnamed protein product [Orchesella dallaii]|uniref:Uncharacterized protein n=1 Tax=Orchesella dallaii TaxID=48710 RepID=A0ABP1RRD0_9HEXA
MAKERDRLKGQRVQNLNIATQYRKLRNYLTNKLWEARRKYCTSTFEKVKTSTDVWNAMNILTKFRSKSTMKVAKLVNSDGLGLESDEDICRQFATEFVVKSSESNVSECLADLEDYVECHTNSTQDLIRKFLIHP